MTPRCGSIAQLGEHLPYKQRVTGSSPVVPTRYGPVVQLVRTLACHARGRRFEPVPGRHLKVKNADVAHLVERHLAKVEVASSSLVIRSIRYHSQVVRPRSAKPLFPGSNPGGPSM